MTVSTVAIEAWLAALQARHRGNLTNAEFLKAVRALSARYVERRSELHARSPVDSSGKRAAFPAFYAPQHFWIVREIIDVLDAPATSILDLGCGTGVASAAIALAAPHPVDITGIDTNRWALSEAAWNWRQLDVHGRIERGDLVKALAQRVRRQRDWHGTVIVAGWSINELDTASRAELLPLLLECGARAAGILIVEPLAGAAAPWWTEWAAAFAAAGGRADIWRLSAALPAALDDISDAAGFRRDRLTARTLVLRGTRRT